MVGASALRLGGRQFDSDPNRVVPKTSLVHAISLLDTRNFEDRAWATHGGRVGMGDGGRGGGVDFQINCPTDHGAISNVTK